MFEAPFYTVRSPLTNFAAAMAKKDITIGFIGGSITDQRSRNHWADMLTYELCSAYPEVFFHIRNAAIGATNSLHALFRAEADLGKDCDIIFIEFAVNDLGMTTGQRNRVREGLIRKLWRPDCDLVFTYTYDRSMLADMMAHRLPDSVSEFETLAEHYGSASVFMGSYALDCVQKGRLRYEEWLPDGLHPAHCGSRFYAAPVLAMLTGELQRSAGTSAPKVPVPALPQPLYPNHYENAHILPFSQLHRKGFWYEQRPIALPLVRQTLSSFAPGSSLTFEFVGSGFVIMVDFGDYAADFDFRIDGGERQCSNFPKEAWIQAGWGVMRYVVQEDLSPGKHHVELSLCLRPEGEAQGCNLDICYVGILP